MSKKSTAPTPGGATGARKKRGDSPLTPPTLSTEPIESKQADIIWDEALENLRIKETDWDQIPGSAQSLPDERRAPALAVVAVKRKRQFTRMKDDIHESEAFPEKVRNGKKVAVVKVAPENSKIEELTALKRFGQKEKEHTIFSQQKSSAKPEKNGEFSDGIWSSIVHHDKRMLERQIIHDQMMTRTGRQPNELIMNSETREKEFQRSMIERMLPFSETKGFGFWRGAEFWRQHQWIGGEERGIFDTPGQIQRGYPAPVEKADVADAIKHELGMPVQSSIVPQNIEEKFRDMKQMYALGRDLEPHTPDIRELIILPYRKKPLTHSVDRETSKVTPRSNGGLSSRQNESGADILSKMPDVVTPSLAPGPALKVNDKLLKPEDTNLDEENQYLETRVVFECMAGGTACQNRLEMTNMGTTVIFYSWKKLPVENNFKNFSTQPILSVIASNPLESFENISHVPPLPPVEPQRFYFDQTHGSLLPGATSSLPIVFKSDLAGVFSERWLLIPTPPAMPAVVINLRGAAEQPDHNALARAQLTTELSEREALSVCKALVRSIIDGVRTPPRPSSPIGEPGRKLKALGFRQQNANLYFDWQLAGDMDQLWKSACQVRKMPAAHEEIGEQPEYEEWDLNVETLYNVMTEAPEGEELDEESMELLLAQLNDNVSLMGLSDISSDCDQKGTAGRVMISSAVDSLSENGIALRQALGLPPPPDIPQPRPASSVAGQLPGGKGQQPTGTKRETSRGSASKISRGGQSTSGSVAQTGETPPPPQSSGSQADLGIIRSPSELSTTDPNQKVVMAKYVDKLQTASRTRMKEIIHALVDNVSDISESKGDEKKSEIKLRSLLD